MHERPTSQQLALLASELLEYRPLPNALSAESQLIAFARAFRHRDEALQYAQHILLDRGQHLTGGYTIDSVGDLWWIGVQMDTLDQWRSNGGFHRVATLDPEAPVNGML